MSEIFKIKSISQFHKMIGFPPPDHPLISLIESEERKEEAKIDEKFFDHRFTSEMYLLLYKSNVSGSLEYGRTTYDFEEGSLLFMAPGQVFAPPRREQLQKKRGSWSLLIHPDLLRNSSLGENIDKYSFFSYEVNEALHLSAKEEKFVLELVKKIKDEYSQNIDKHSQQLIISNLELLLNYCLRYYDRQFYSRANQNIDIVSQFEKLLKNYFSEGSHLEGGLPSILFFAKKIHLSPHYLSDLLKKETGRTAKDHINDFVVEKAKDLLLGTNDTVGEIAYSLGFNYPHYFSRLFKSKTGMTPGKYRSAN